MDSLIPFTTSGIENIYIARHGFRANWVSDVWESPTGMARDPPLAAYGIEQAERLATNLSSPPAGQPTPELVFCSPFYRCIQTSIPLARELGIPVRIEHGVAEWYSRIPASKPHNLHPRAPSPHKLAHLFPPSTLSLTYHPSTFYPSRRGESLSDLLTRCSSFLTAFLARLAAEFPEVKTVILVGHAASVIALGRALTGDEALEVTAGCCSYSLYKRRQGGGEVAKVGEWDIELNGEAGHLEKGVERNWSYRDVILGPEGEVVDDPGVPGTEDESNDPCGLGPGMEKYWPSDPPKQDHLQSAL